MRKNLINYLLVDYYFHHHQYKKFKFNKLSKDMPKDIDWTELNEELDYTTSSQELACTAGACEI